MTLPLETSFDDPWASVFLAHIHDKIDVDHCFVDSAGQTHKGESFLVFKETDWPHPEVPGAPVFNVHIKDERENPVPFRVGVRSEDGLVFDSSSIQPVTPSRHFYAIATALDDGSIWLQPLDKDSSLEDTRADGDIIRISSLTKNYSDHSGDIESLRECLVGEFYVTDEPCPRLISSPWHTSTNEQEKNLIQEAIGIAMDTGPQP